MSQPEPSRWALRRRRLRHRLHGGLAWLAGRRPVRQERPLRRFVPLFLAVWLILAALPGAPRPMIELPAGAAALTLLAGVF